MPEEPNTIEKKDICILVVDDDEAARETIVDLLTEDGYTVRGTDSGMNALELLEQYTFDLVISDLVMPKMDGISLTKNIRSQGLDVPIIVITGFATIGHAVASMKAGAFDFITKPFNVDQIKITVEKALETKRLVRMARQSEFYKKLSNCDELTQLANYRSFIETLQNEIERAHRYSRPLALMMIDIDDFKVCNDTYGHLAGDMVLKQIAGLIKKNTRGSDFVARYGGEEFFAILPESTEEEARVVAERIREEIENFEFKSDDGTPLGKQTVTIGISSMPKRANSKKELIHTTDAAMYNGKAAGKNCVIFYEKAE